MTHTKTKKMVLVALLAAVTILLGYYFKLPTPTGLVSLLDVGIYFTAFSIGGAEAALVGALSGFAIDLLAGYPQWMFFSMIIHGLQGYFAAFKKGGKILGLLLASLVMVLGYALVSSFMYGMGSALAEVIPNLTQNLVGMVLGYLLSRAVKLPKES